MHAAQLSSAVLSAENNRVRRSVGIVVEIARCIDQHFFGHDADGPPSGPLRRLQSGYNARPHSTWTLPPKLATWLPICVAAIRTILRRFHRADRGLEVGADGTRLHAAARRFAAAGVLCADDVQVATNCDADVFIGYDSTAADFSVAPATNNYSSRTFKNTPDTCDWINAAPGNC